MADKMALPPDSDLPRVLSSPAHNALVYAGFTRLEQLRHKTEREIAALHGMGPKGIRMLKDALAERGWAFAETSKK
jgi:DNA-directed RNA polymerase alpha subunit